METFYVRSACQLCQEKNLIPILSLGQTPLANAYLTPEQLSQLWIPASAFQETPSTGTMQKSVFIEPLFPLTLAFCPSCSLVQLLEVVSPDVLFRDYLYFTSFSETTLAHARQLAQTVIEKYSLNSSHRVVEVASNDGYLLQYFRQEGIAVLGIEPAENIARKAQEERSIPTRAEFFGRVSAQRLVEEGYRADVILANNVIAHVPDIHDFVEGLRILLKEKTGHAVIEIPYFKAMMDHGEFDMIYHEHMQYYTLTTLQRLFNEHQLVVEDVEQIPIQGGSLRLFISHCRCLRHPSPPLPRHPPVADATPSGKGNFPHKGGGSYATNEDDLMSGQVRALLEEEQAWGVGKKTTYEPFGRKAEKIKQELVRLLSNLKKQGKRIAGYGAAAKATTLLSFCQIGKETLDFVVDKSVYKQGRFMPGNHLPIYAPEKLLDEQPDYTLILAWNFAPEIIKQLDSHRRHGGQFILPLPEPRIWENTLPLRD